MASFRNPILFSTYFKIDPSVLAIAGLLDPFLNVDTPLFIDPVLLPKSLNPIISTDATQSFRESFSNVIRLLKLSKAEGDVAWKGATKILNLSEAPGTGLGYGRGRRKGTSRPTSICKRVLRTSKEIIDLGSSDPDMISAMPFLEEDVGADTISDFATHTILQSLCKITNHFCNSNSIPTSWSSLSQEYRLPIYRTTQASEPIVLVPRDIVKELPVAEDWSQVSKVIEENELLRDRISILLGNITKATISEQKAATRRVATESASLFNEFITAIRVAATAYDPNLDTLGYYRLRELLSSGKLDLKVDNNIGPIRNSTDLRRVIDETIAHFRNHIEDGNLWEELWANGKPKRERAAQLIYYAIAEVFCKVNDVDISPEANMGGGPVDFKFSRGPKLRYLVEVKRSTGNVVHGYEKQLEFYKRTAETENAIFLVVDFGDLGDKLSKIEKLRLERLRLGAKASDIVVVDARPKKSASKRD